MQTTDFVIIGGGIVGLSIARELKRRNASASIIVIEKEPEFGLHSSGRNSGVLHSGIYYPAGSLKARVCGQGALEMAEYCRSRGLPLVRMGKVLVPVNAADGPQLDVLEARAAANGVPVQRLDAAGLKALEPEAHSATGEALFVASTSVGSSGAVMQKMVEEARSEGITLLTSASPAAVDVSARLLTLANGERIGFGHAINAAGLHADTVAHMFDTGHDLVLLPFKGIYWKLDPAAGLDIRHLIYPVPDLRVPFLGVHTTTATDGTIYLGPTAVPAFGRENYRGLDDVNPTELTRILGLLARQFVTNSEGFRRLAIMEAPRYLKSNFARAARRLLPRLEVRHLLPSQKVGIRAQMFDKAAGKLVTDFRVERGPSSTHVLNAISPAWTSAFPFARYIVDTFIENRGT